MVKKALEISLTLRATLLDPVSHSNEVCVDVLKDRTLLFNLAPIKVPARIIAKSGRVFASIQNVVIPGIRIRQQNEKR